MIPKPAQYLLRFDDLCPTMAHHRWQRFLPLIEEFHLRPILAVIPDNQDTELNLSAPDLEFWVSDAGDGGSRSHDCVARPSSFTARAGAGSLLPLHLHSDFPVCRKKSRVSGLVKGWRFYAAMGSILRFLLRRATASTTPPCARCATRDPNALRRLCPRSINSRRRHLDSAAALEAGQEEEGPMDYLCA